MASTEHIRRRRWIPSLAAALVLFTAVGLVLPNDEPVTPESLNEQGRYAEAEALSRERLAAAEADHGPDSLEAARILDSLVRALWRQGKFREPETLTLAERAVRVKEEHLGPDDPEVAKSLLDLGILQHYLGDLERAREIHARALEILEREHGPDSFEVAPALNALAVDVSRLGRPDEALELYERARVIRETELGPVHPDVAKTLLNMAQLNEEIGRYREALELALRGSEILEQTLGSDHPTTARSYGSVALQLGTLGNYREMIEYGRRQVEGCRTAFGEDHPEFGWSLMNLGAVTMQVGRYAEALDLVEQAYPILVAAFGEEHHNLAYAEIQMGKALRFLGDYELAADWQRRAVDRRRVGLGPDHPLTLDAQEFLAELLIAAGERVEAMDLLEQTLESRRRVQGADHPLVARVMHQVAVIQVQDGDAATARATLEEVLEIRLEALGEDHEAVGDTRLVLAQAMIEQGAHAEAGPHLDRALEIYINALGAEHPRVAEVLRTRARFNWAAGNPALAFDDALRAEAIGRDHLRLTARSQPEAVALRYARVRSSALDLALTLATEQRSPTEAARAWDAVVRSRAVVLDEMAHRNRALVAGGDAEVERLASEVVAARTRLANLTIRSLGRDESVDLGPLLAEARAERQQAERALASRSTSFAAESVRDDIGLDEVIERLGMGTALVAYYRFDRAADPTQPSRQSEGRRSRAPGPAYLAFVRPPDDAAPVVVELGTAEEIDESIRAWRETLIEVPTAALRRSESGYREIATSLRRRIWDPLVPHLGAAERVLIVPDGSVNLLAFAALPAEGNRYLLERGPLLHYLSSERDLVPPPTSAEPAQGLLAIGGAAFDADEPVRSTHDEVFRGRRSGCSAFRLRRFDPLPETAREVDDIAALWIDRSGVDPESAVVRTGPAASEAAFKREAPGRQVLHLATHGFFLDESCISSTESERDPHGLRENPLLSAGLAFAGANRRASALPGADDGILTAEEIGALDLGGVEWAVLSACDTGVGEIRAGEGVLGLRRAFEVAGTRTLIMSLWPVEDRAARRWMRELYGARLENGSDIARAARAASLAVLERQRASDLGGHPSRWAAFVAAGGWR
jgi:CHAT domain-containing protein/tetratricopeptide (TPR) repeat protein